MCVHMHAKYSDMRQRVVLIKPPRYVPIINDALKIEAKDSDYVQKDQHRTLEVV